MSTEHARVQTETLKLLLQLAWGDDHLSGPEIAILARLARDAGVEPAFADAMPIYLAGGLPLPPPDLGLLRGFKPGVFALADLVLHADGLHCDREREVRDELARLLD